MLKKFDNFLKKVDDNLFANQKKENAKSEGAKESDQSTNATATASTTPAQPVRVVKGDTTPVTGELLLRAPSLQGLRDKAGQMSAAAQRGLGRRALSSSCAPAPPVVASAYRDDNVIVSAGGDLLNYYQRLWRRVNQLSASQAKMRTKVDVRLKHAGGRLRQRAVALEVFSLACASIPSSLETLQALNNEIDAIGVQTKAVDDFIVQHAAVQAAVRDERRTQQAFAAAAELDLRHFAEISTNGSSSSSSSSTSSTTNEASNDALQASSHSTDAEERKLAEVVVAPDDGTLDDFLKDVDAPMPVVEMKPSDDDAEEGEEVVDQNKQQFAEAQ